MARDLFMPDLTKTVNVSDNCNVTSVTQNVTLNTVLESDTKYTVLVTAVDASGNRYICFFFEFSLKFQCAMYCHCTYRSHSFYCLCE